jgi:ribosomal biogenesis protein LAS1
MSLTTAIKNTQDQGILRLKSYETKTKLPHCVSITGQLISLQHEIHSVRMTEEGAAQDAKLVLMKEDHLKLSISMTVIRFVNGLLDPSQQSQFAIPLNVLARKINLPNWFVELRHSGTHENLASLEMLEIAVDSAVEWTYLNYWVKLDEKAEEGEEDEEEEEEEEKIKELEELFKSYRRIRRDNLNKVFKVGDTSELGREYWKVMLSICERFEEDGENGNNNLALNLFVRFLKRYKFEQGKILYLALLDYLYNVHFDKIFKVLEVMFIRLYEFHNQEIGDDGEAKNNLLKINNTKESKIIESWINWLVLDKLDSFKQNEWDLIKLVDLLGRYNNPINVQVLEKLKGYDDLAPSVVTKLDSKLKKRKHTERRTITEDVDSITNDLENLKKRIKSNKKGKSQPKLFEPYPNWQPKPFGVL